MSLGLIKPGASVALRHPKTGAILMPLYTRKDGTAVWPVLGASSDDPDDDTFTGGGGGGGREDDDSDEDEDDDDDEDDKKKSSKKSKSSKDDEDDDDDDEDDEDDSRLKASRQAKRYRLALRAEQAKNKEMADRLSALENKDKKPDELASAELTTARESVTKLTAQNAELNAKLQFFSTKTGIEWADPSDVFTLATAEGLFEDAVDEDGKLDPRELRRGLRDLAKRKPHLVKAAPKTASKGDDDEDDEKEEPRSSSTANRSRRGSKGTTPTRAELAKKFPVLGR